MTEKLRKFLEKQEIDLNQKNQLDSENNELNYEYTTENKNITNRENYITSENEITTENRINETKDENENDFETFSAFGCCSFSGCGDLLYPDRVRKLFRRFTFRLETDIGWK